MATPRPRLYPFQHCTVKKMYQEWLGQYYYRKASFLSVGGGKVKIKEASRLFCGNNFTFECVYPYLQVVRRILPAKLSVLDIWGGDILGEWGY